MTPAASIGTNHIASMSNRTKIEAIVFRFDDVLVAHPYSNPIWTGLFYFKCHFLDIAAIFEVWLHNCKFISRTVWTFDNGVADDHDIGVFELGSEFEGRLFPEIEVLLDGIDGSAISLNFWYNLVHVFLDISSQILSGGFKRVHNLWLSQ